MRVAYAGEPGAFGELAAQAVRPDAEPWPLPSFQAVAEAVARGEVEAGVVPVENSIAGAVAEGVAAVLSARPWISGEVRVRVRQLLLAPVGLGLAEVREVHSHPQALAQCRRFLAERGLRAVAEANTATAARLVAEGRWPKAAAIAGRAAAERFGLRVIAEGIADAERSETRFYVLGRVEGGGPRTVQVIARPPVGATLASLRPPVGAALASLRPPVGATHASPFLGDTAFAQQSRSGDRSHRSGDAASADPSRSEDRSHRSSDTASAQQSRSGDRSHRSSDTASAQQSRSEDRSHRSGDTASAQQSRSEDRSHRSGDTASAQQSRSEDRSHRSGDTASAQQSRSGDRSHRSGDTASAQRSEDRSHRSGGLLELDGDDLPDGAVLLGRIARAGPPDQTDATASTSS